MIELNLGGKWKMRDVRQADWLDAEVPGSVMLDLLQAGTIKDPFYRDREDEYFPLSLQDYEYMRSFDVDSALLRSDELVLVCKGLDTLAEIEINGKAVGRTDNMHRTYKFDMKPVLKAGENEIRVVFRSPVKYVQELHKEMPLWGIDCTVEGYPHLRKAHYMFGWDWGPKIPDAGIWRSMAIHGYQAGRLDDVYVTQHHDAGTVTLSLACSQILYDRDQAYRIEAVITGPDHKVFRVSKNHIANREELMVEIPDPQVWWPNGWGKQHLYQVQVNLYCGEKLMDERAMKIGLRTIKINQKPDEWGESFEFEVNGKAIFAMGANYIPQDNLLGRVTSAKTESLIQDCVDANFNMIRVWGGGIYPEDHFFDLCDQYGLIVWQDFMFACGVYNLTDAFADSIAKEAEDNIKRIRHHACLGIWCGNNEMEEGWAHWGFPKTAKLRTDYLKQFEILIPEVVKQHDPATFYWPSSPSSGGGFDDPNSQNKGDVHYWEVWHAQKPFTEYRNYHFRFASEYGFQSFPSFKTVQSYTEPEDQNIFSYVMEKHQKNGAANGKILYYLSEYLKYPKDFPSLLYASQILQAEAIKYGVEHWRRHRGRCMGSLYWQLNDCWPVASWSSIDSRNRWKALHYFAKKFYAPLLISACENETDVSLHITNDTFEPFRGAYVWELRDHGNVILANGGGEVSADPLQATKLADLNFDNELQGHKRRTRYLAFRLLREGEVVSSGTVLFTKPKHFEFVQPAISCRVEEADDAFSLTLSSQAYAKYIELDLTDGDARFSDNYFDLSGGETMTIKALKASLSKNYDADTFRQSLTIRSVIDLA